MVSDVAFNPPRSARPLLTLLCALGLLLAGAPCVAAHVKFTASISPEQCYAGDEIELELKIEASEMVQITGLEKPDLGGMSYTGYESNSVNTNYINNQLSYSRSFIYRIAAARAGEYTIGPASITADKREYRTQPLTLRVSDAPQVQVPEDFSGEDLLYPQTNDVGVDRRYRGRIFLRPEISDRQPWVGEAVVITYWLYMGDFDPRSAEYRGIQPPDKIENAVRDELINPGQYTVQTRQVGGRTYSVMLVYRMAVTPNRAGRLEFPGLTMSLALPRDPDWATNRSPGGRSGVLAMLPTPKVALDVKPLPTPLPDNFTGTIGDYTISAQLDRREATEDDLITLKVRLEGRGAIEQALSPIFPATRDFELNGESSSYKYATDGEGLKGTKEFELVLRPLTSGALEIPPIDYLIFDPYRGEYRPLRIDAQPVKIAPGEPTRIATAQDGHGRDQDAFQQLQYLKTFDTLQRDHTSPLLQAPAFWGGQILLGALFCGMCVRRRRLDRLDPAQQRRGRAWQAFERRLREAPANDPVRTAEVLDQAARGFLADRYNTSAEGLTRPEIERLLRNGTISDENVRAICDAIDELQALRYAPVQPTRDAVAQRSEKLRNLLREALR